MLNHLRSLFFEVTLKDKVYWSAVSLFWLFLDLKYLFFQLILPNLVGVLEHLNFLLLS